MKVAPGYCVALYPKDKKSQDDCIAGLMKKSNASEKTADTSFVSYPSKQISLSQLRLLTQQEPEVWDARSKKPIVISWEPKDTIIQKIELVSFTNSYHTSKLGRAYPIYEQASKLTIFGSPSRGVFTIDPKRVSYFGDHGIYFVKITSADGAWRISSKPVSTNIDEVLDAEKIRMIKGTLSFYTLDPKTGAFLSAMLPSSAPTRSGKVSSTSFSSLGIYFTELERKSFNSCLVVKSDTFKKGTRIFLNQPMMIDIQGEKVSIKILEVHESSGEKKNLCTSDKSWCQETDSYLLLEVNGIQKKMWRGEIFQIVVGKKKAVIIAADIETPPMPSDFLIVDYK